MGGWVWLCILGGARHGEPRRLRRATLDLMPPRVGRHTESRGWVAAALPRRKGGGKGEFQEQLRQPKGKERSWVVAFE